MDLEQKKYPIGKEEKLPFTAENKTKALQTISNFPTELRKAVALLTNNELDTPYREDGWTKKQVIHHCADSHMNAYIRFKLALTEDRPTIKAYDEAAWAELEDSNAPIEVSLVLLDALHQRWAIFLNKMTDEDFQRTYYHPQNKTESTLGQSLLHYDWHCRHHLAHITS
jgi:hypothetical protein